MNERLLARLLFSAGMLTISLMVLFDFRCSDSGAAARIGFTIGVIATAIGIGLDIKHRRQDRRLRDAAGGGAA